jgi:hypothetical protein
MRLIGTEDLPPGLVARAARPAGHARQNTCAYLNEKALIAAT